MKRIIGIALTAASLSFGAMDYWVESGEMVRYRNDTHFSGVGFSAESSEKAKNNAIAEVRKQISVKVNSTEIVREFDLLDGGEHKNTSSYRNRTRLAASGDMQGVEIIETAKRDDGYYAFAALNKEHFVKNGRAKIKDLNKELKKHYKAASNATVQNDIVTVVNEIGAARNVLRNIISTGTLLTAATVLTDKDAPVYTGSDLSALYESVIASIEVKKMGGDKQEIVLGAVPTEPFGILVEAHGAPVPYMPFSLVTSDGKELQRRTTNLSGEVLFFLGEDAETAKGRHTFKVVPALELTGNAKGRTRELTTRFSYKVTGTPKFANVSVKIPKRMEDDRDDLETAVRSMLAKYDIVYDSCACQRVDVVLDVQDGESIQGVSANRSYARSEVKATISVVDANGRTRHSVVKSANGTGSNTVKAAAKAIEVLKIKDDINELKGALGEEDPDETPKEAPRKKKIVIFDFRNGDNISGWYQTAETITAMITTEMINSGHFDVIERDQISKIVKEKNFAGDDLDFAKLAGADYAIVGNASRVNGKIELDARLVSMENGTAVGVGTVTGHKYADLRMLSKTLIKNLKVEGKSLEEVAKSSGGACCK